MANDKNGIFASTQQNNSRIDWIDQLKGFAMIFIVLGHVTLSKQVPHVIFCYAFHIPLFFIISGMTSKLYRNRHPLENENILEFIKTKARQLLLPYLLWNLIAIPANYFNIHVVNGKSYDLVSQLKGIIYSNQDKVRAPSDAMWFVLTLFLAVVLFDILERVFKQDSLKIMLAGFGGFLLTYADSVSNKGFLYPWHIQVVPAAVFFLSIGYFFIENYSDIISGFDNIFKSIPAKVIVIVILHAAAVVLALKNGKSSMPGSRYNSPVLYLIIIFLMAWILTYIAIKLKPVVLFTFIGKNTITYMALHTIILAFMKLLFPVVNDWIEKFPYLPMLILLLILIPISMFTNKFLPHFVGKRFKKAS